MRSRSAHDPDNPEQMIQGWADLAGFVKIADENGLVRWVRCREQSDLVREMPIFQAGANTARKARRVRRRKKAKTLSTTARSTASTRWN